MTIKKLIPCTLTAAVLASAALTGCSSKGTSDKSTTAAKTSAQETKETATKSAETKDTEAGSSEVNTSAEAKSEEESKKAETELGSEEVSTEIGTGESADDLLAQIKERGNIVVACIPAGRLNNRCTGLQQPFRFRIFYHSQRNTVLYAARRIKVFQFDDDTSFQVLVFTIIVQLQQRSIAN